MKIKTILLASLSVFMVGSLASCGNASAPIQLKTEVNEISWSDREMGFRFRLHESTKLEGHDISYIEFNASKEDVTIEKVFGYGDDYLNYEWKAVCMSAGSFTVSATLDNLTSNTLTFTVKEGQIYNMEYNIPNGYQIQYTNSHISGEATYERDYTVTKLNDSYMVTGAESWENRFYEKISNNSYKCYSYSTNNGWEFFTNYNESQVFELAFGILYPDPATKTTEYGEKDEFSETIDDKEYKVTRLEYYRLSPHLSYGYISCDDGLKMCIICNVHRDASTVIDKSSRVNHIKTVEKFPLNPPSAE